MYKCLSKDSRTKVYKLLIVFASVISATILWVKTDKYSITNKAVLTYIPFLLGSYLIFVKHMLTLGGFFYSMGSFLAAMIAWTESFTEESHWIRKYILKAFTIFYIWDGISSSGLVPFKYSTHRIYKNVGSSVGGIISVISGSLEEFLV